MSNVKKIRRLGIFIDGLFALICISLVYFYTTSAMHMHKPWAETVSSDFLFVAIFFLFAWRYFRFVRFALLRKKKIDERQGKITNVEDAAVEQLRTRSGQRLVFGIAFVIIAIVSYYVLGFLQPPV